MVPSHLAVSKLTPTVEVIFKVSRIILITLREWDLMQFGFPPLWLTTQTLSMVTLQWTSMESTLILAQWMISSIWSTLVTKITFTWWWMWLPTTWETQTLISHRMFHSISLNTIIIGAISHRPVSTITIWTVFRLVDYPTWLISTKTTLLLEASFFNGSLVWSRTIVSMDYELILFLKWNLISGSCSIKLQVSSNLEKYTTEVCHMWLPMLVP